MKKMKFISMAAAMFAACAMLSSCWGGSSDDPVSPSGSGDVAKVAAETFSIKVSSNQPVTFTIDVAADAKVDADKKGATFSNISTVNQVVKLKASLVDATGYVTATQVAIIKLSSATPSANISFDFAKKSTKIATQAEVLASGATINSNLSAVDASMVIPAGTIVTGSTDDFSVTAYKATPETVTADEITVGSTVASDPKIMVLDCTPSGATFDQNVTLKVYIGTELAGETVTIENNGETTTAVVDAAGYAEFSVSHFSLWNILFAPVVTDISKVSITLLNVANYQVSEGINTYSFTKNVGTQFSASGIIGLYISKIFGDTTSTIVEEGSFTATERGTATINVVQNYSDYVFGFGTKKFTVRVWDGTVSTVSIVGGGTADNTEPQNPAGHSGGSGN
jgi:hypothetical protein